MKTLIESILSSTKTGKEAIKKQIEEWLKSNNVKDFDINDDNSISMYTDTRTFFEIKTDIPKYIKIKYCSEFLINTPEALNVVPEECAKLAFENITIKDFTFLEKMKKCAVIYIHNCDIKSFKGLNKVNGLINLVVSGNKYAYTIKEISKESGLKPQIIRNIGKYKWIYNDYVISAYEESQVDNHLSNLIKKVVKEIPEIKFTTTDVRKNSSNIYFSFDFIDKDKIPHGIRQNSVYLRFVYDIDDSKLELYDNGHIDIMPAERETTKYKYYALKSLLDPYYDNGGKKFRKTLIKDFYSDEIADKIIPFIKDVIAAALENQGGNLERK
jgi:hypothetical protein